MGALVSRSPTCSSLITNDLILGAAKNIWLRQEENQYLCCPPDIAKNLDTNLQNLLGYTQGDYGFGHYSDPYSKDEVMILEPEKALR